LSDFHFYLSSKCDQLFILIPCGQKMGLNFMKGLQGDNPKYLKVAACAKHFAVHSGPERLRHVFDAEVTNKDLNETYLPAFKTLVEGGVESIMCAYNRTNTEPCCGSALLLVDILRKKWGFKGHVVSDCGAIRDINEGHKVTTDKVHSVTLSLKKGVNLNCGEEYYPYLIDAVKQGLVTEEEINQSLAVLLKTRFKLGMFDKDENNPYAFIPESVINSDKHRKIALESAQKSIVLLKNNGVLPLKKTIHSLFLTGPNATSVDALLGNYYGLNQNMVTIQEGLLSHISKGTVMQYKQGFLAARDNVNPKDWTSGDAKMADVCIVSMGLTGNLEGEEVVQLYIRREDGNIITPLFSLKGFQRVHLKAGEAIKVNFLITPEMMSNFDNNGDDVLKNGRVQIFIGGSLPTQRSIDLGMSPVLHSEVEIN